MATGGLYGSTSTGTVAPQSGSESVGLYGNNTVFGGTYFEWFVFQESATTLATPTGGSWNFTTNIGTPPTGWSNYPPVTPINKVWVSIALVNSKSNQSLVWSTPGQFVVPSGTGTVFNVSALTLGTSGTDVSSTVANPTTTPVITLNLPTSSATNRGLLSAADWSTFNNKQPSGTYVNSVAATSPVLSSGGLTPTISMAAANGTTNGYLSSTDWTTFNNKQAAGTYINSVSATAPIFSSGGLTPTISIVAANATTNGYLSSTDWATFNNKQPAGTYVNAVNGSTGRITSSGGTTPTIDLTSGIVSPGVSGSSSLIPVVTVDTYGRVTNVTTAPNPQGTVTSIAATVPSFLSVAGSPITSSGTISITYSGTALPITNGGTGATTAAGALTSLGAIGSVASVDGSVAVVQTGTSIDLSVATSGSTTTVLTQVRNTTGATLTKGTLVYMSGATGQLPTVSKALATSDATSAQTLGMMTTDLANNSNGYVTVIGLISNIDTSAFSDGDQLYLSGTTAGTYTSTKPYAPIHLVYVGFVEYAHPTQGKIFVKVQNGYELDEIHNVSARTPTTGQTIVWNSSTNLWEQNTVSLTAGVNGTLPINNGGTGSTNASAALTALGAYPATNPNGYTTTNYATITDDTTTNAVRYPLFATATSGNLTTEYVSSSKFQFNPSTGTLTVSSLIIAP